MRLGPRPTIYELNAAAWLARLGGEAGRRIALDEVPATEWDRLAALHIDAVWLMGVWERSPAGREIALRDPALRASFRAALPDLRDEDVIGSAYCVRAYELEPRFGSPDALAVARAELAARGVGLILDFVPNHVAPDHDWTTGHPEYFIRGDARDLEAHPGAFVQTPGGVLANGKDPYFAPWTDVVQLNAFEPGLRATAIDALASIGARCDGVRCDMAMLMTNDVFAATWGERAGPVPSDEYWPAVIAGARASAPDLLFMAEAYWDMEWTLQRQGFDLCYDKRLYDRLVGESAAAVRGHLRAAADYQERLVRFIENHDEPRAADTFESRKARAAAVVMSTVPGARLVHDGQLDGLRTRVPVQLARAPAEPVDVELSAFYDRLLADVAESGLGDGDWQLCECSGSPDSAESLLVWCRRAGEQRRLVVVNFADRVAQGRVRLPWRDLAGRTWHLHDVLSDAAFDRDGSELRDEGLSVEMAPWEARILKLGVRLAR